jgi:hypothetical protein
MSLIIKGMKLPKHADVNGEKNTAYRCIILAHPDNSVELVIDTEFTSAYDNGHNIQRYPLAEIPSPHGDLIDKEPIKEFISDGINKPSPESYGYDGIEILSEIEFAPVIIEAEVSE